MFLLFIALHAVIAYCLVWLADTISAVPFDRSLDAHWTEKARMLWPVRIANSANVLVVPLLLHALHWHLAPSSILAWPLYDLAAFVGAWYAGYPLARKVYPSVDHNAWLLAAWPSLITILLSSGLPVFAGLAMPPAISPLFWLLTLSYLGLHIANLYGSVRWLLRRTGQLHPASMRLQQLIDKAIKEQNVPIPRCWELETLDAQAYALPITKELMFTRPLLASCTDAELSSIVQHELAHLNEPCFAKATRLIASLVYAPLVFITPLMAWLGFSGFILAIALFYLLHHMRVMVGQRMEVRADAHAVTNQSVDGTYARALLIIHRHNLIPAVMGGSNRTHPHLYDRMQAAGIHPEFERPTAAASFSTPGRIYSIALGILFAIAWISSTR